MWGRFNEQMHGILGLTDDIAFEYDAFSGDALHFTLRLPNGQSLRLVCGGWDGGAKPDGPTFEIDQTVWLGAQADPEADEEFVLQCLVTLKKLLRRHQAQTDWSESRLKSLLQEHAQYQDVRDEYFRRIFTGVTGSTANFRLGFRCNQDCHFCWQNRRWPNPPLEMYFQWLEEIADFGIEQIVFTGGEPTLHRDFPSLLAKAKQEYGMKTMVQTNATTFHNRRYLERVRQAEVDRLFISLHAGTAEISDRMTRAPNTFDLTVQGVELALQAGLRVGLNCVVERENYRDLPNLARLIVERFVAPFPENPIESMTFSRPQSYYDRQKWHEQIMPMDEIEPHLEEAIELLLAHGVLLDITAGSCGLPACLIRRFPSLIYLPKAEHVGMADPSHSQEARKNLACGQCSLFDNCQGPGHQYIEQFGDRGLVAFEGEVPFSHVFPLQL